MSKTVEFKLPSVSSNLLRVIATVTCAIATVIFMFTMTDGRDMTEGRAAVCFVLGLGMLVGTVVLCIFTVTNWLPATDREKELLRNALDVERDYVAKLHRSMARVQQELINLKAEKQSDGEDS